MSRQTISSENRKSRGRASVVPFKRPTEKALGMLCTKLFTTATTSARMARVKQRSTVPERKVRRACTAIGMRYRIANAGLPGSPDLANRSRKWAIFVHGCYWHRHAACPKATFPRTNVGYWSKKFARNIARDEAAQVRLKSLGFVVLTVWECETNRPDVLAANLASIARKCC
jgi:DNA mismatch endonuclease (patch repair protein)